MALTMEATVDLMPEVGPVGAGTEASEDHRLVARIAAGDDLALARVYDRYGGLVFGLARRVTGSATAAEEITQEVFTFLWEHADRFDSERGTLRGFLGAVAHRRAVDAVRRDTRRVAREERVGHDPSLDHPIDDAADRMARDDLATKVRAAVAALPDDQRVALELAYFRGCTFREVAVRLGIPEGTAKSRLRLALGKLAGLLGPEVATL